VSKLVLFGTGRGAEVAHRFIAADSEHEIIAFTVDEANMTSKLHRGLPVVPFEEVQHRYPPDRFGMLILLGYQQMNGLRARKFAEAKAKGYRLESYVASNIFRVAPIEVGENCFILDNQSISLNVRIGNNVVMWSSNHIGDLSEIADHAWISSHVTVAANVHIGERAFLGIGATVSNGVKIGADSFIGACRLVSDDTRPRSVSLADQSAEGVDSSTFMRLMTARKKL
jgi:sugar O-acyltransferase (sialic acid O-acetyltransferase NeuD family)